MKHFRIALLPGDGIGAEITNETVKVLEKVAEASGFSFTGETFSVGAMEYQENGDATTSGYVRKMCRL